VHLVGTIITAVGTIFLFLGSLGILRLPDVYNRLVRAVFHCVIEALWINPSGLKNTRVRSNDLPCLPFSIFDACWSCGN